MGSGKNMVQVNEWDTNGITICGVNNTWRGTDKWDVLLHAGDYPYKQEVRKARTKPTQEIVSREGPRGFKQSYVGMSDLPWEKARIHLGLPIYFTMAYWALWHLKPDAIGFIGFDMNYTPGPKGETTFYGKGYDMQKRGVPDPLFQFKKHYSNLEKPIETLLQRLDDRRGDTQFYNLSSDPKSVLPWNKITIQQFKEL